MSTQECTCGRMYGPGSDERQRHRILLGHTPSPAAAAERVDLDALVRAAQEAERAARRTGGAR